MCDEAVMAGTNKNQNEEKEGNKSLKRPIFQNMMSSHVERIKKINSDKNKVRTTFDTFLLFNKRHQT